MRRLVRSARVELWLPSIIMVHSYHTFDPNTNGGFSINPMCDSSHSSQPSCHLTIEPCDKDYPYLLTEKQKKMVNHQECLRKRVRYFFMNPFEKYKIKRVLPFKFFVTICIIIMMTIQVFSFEYHVYNYTQEHRDTERTLRNIFLKGWDNSMDVPSSPPTSSGYAVYTIPDFYENVNYVVKKFGMFGVINTGTYSYDSPDGDITSLYFCKTFFKSGHIFPHNNTISFESEPVEECITIPPLYPAGHQNWSTFSIEHYLRDHNKTIDFSRLIRAKVTFHIKLVFIKAATNFHNPDCYQLNVTIRYKNSKHDGQIPIKLDTWAHKQKCIIDFPNDPTTTGSYVYRQIQNFAVMTLAILLSILVIRSLVRALMLKGEVASFFKEVYGVPLPIKDRFEFVDLWFIVIICANGCLISGSIIKMLIEVGTDNDDLYNYCSILLGVGNLLTWTCLLRYLNYFPEYNIVIVTLKKGFGVLLKAMIATLFIYIGYMICGWLVLAPYHTKFKYLSTTSETLYSLTYGDDMFVTYATLDTKSYLIWLFSRIYLYTFIFIFICVILSVLIAIVLDVYDHVKTKVQKKEDPNAKNLGNFIRPKEGETIENLREIYRSTSTGCFCNDCTSFSIFSLRK